MDMTNFKGLRMMGENTALQHDRMHQHIRLRQPALMQFSYIHFKCSDLRPICTMSAICNPTNTSVKNTLPSSLCVWTP